ncbi:amidohydrolase [Oscillospiraceae bacterium LTW-04]|nr:amidohydrolase [Oscillospiraceae bacterium MB24-C1]
MYEQMITLSNALNDKLTACRRDFHRYPETGWLEMRTSAIIAQRLTDLGYEVLTGKQVCREGARMGLPDETELREHAEKVLQQGAPAAYLTDEMKQGYTGVVGILRCGAGPVVALRFDIDALGMQECTEDTHRPTREGFASRNAGNMHACGHDGHAAIGLGVAEVLMQLKDKLHGTVKLLFQPGEEGARGAAAMVANGLLDDVDFFAGSHIAPDNGPDDGDVTPGTYGSLATTKYDVTFKGRASHAGGFPEQGKNALVAAAAAVMALQAIPRHSGGQSRVNVGTLHAGTGRNVIPDMACMQLEVRGETTEINAYMAEMAVNACNGAALMQGCTCEMVKMGEAQGQQSDPAFIARIAALMRRHLPDLKVSSCENAQNWGSEDISIMMNRVQARGGLATYMRAMTPIASPQHTVQFDFDEVVLSKSVKIFCAIVCDLIGEN